MRRFTAVWPSEAAVAGLLPVRASEIRRRRIRTGKPEPDGGRRRPFAGSRRRRETKRQREAGSPNAHIFDDIYEPLESVLARQLTYFARFASDERRPTSWSALLMPGGTFSTVAVTLVPFAVGSKVQVMVISPA